MQTFNVSANILERPLTVSAARMKLKATHGATTTQDMLVVDPRHVPTAVVRSLGPRVRTRFNDNFFLRCSLYRRAPPPKGRSICVQGHVMYRRHVRVRRMHRRTSARALNRDISVSGTS